MKIEIFLVYPMMGIVNKESNLLRIVDNDLKESLVIYLMEENNQYNVYMMNTMTGIMSKLTTSQDLAEIDNLNDFLMSNKENIMKGEDLESIESYILNLIKH